MGYCAKVICMCKCVVDWTLLPLTILLIVAGASMKVHSVAIPGKTSPGMRTYDIWDPMPNNNNNDDDTIRTKRNTVTALNSDVLLHDYNRKTSLRHGKVLNFFPVLNEDECKTEDGRRSGVCMNVYDCHRNGGISKGQCSLGFGACCVFTASCDQEIKYNITYIVSPNFPAIMPTAVKSCKLKVKMMSEDISQLRFDFVHFSIGQPNRRTGDCDGDIFSLFGGSSGEFKFCGQNNGQHIYYDVPSGKGRDGEPKGVIDVVMNFTSSLPASRFWEIRVSQIPFSQRAPAGCLQYFTGNDGVIQTFNFAENGRHLSNQKYRACVRQEKGMCSIAYEPCNEQAFRIGPTQMPYRPNDLYSNPYQAQYGGFPQNGLYSPNGLYPNGMFAPNGMYLGPNGLPQMYPGPPGMLNMLNPNGPPVPGIYSTNSGGGGGPGGGSSGGAQPIQGDQFSSPSNSTIMNDSINGTMSANETSTSSTTTSTTSTTSTTPAPQDDEVEGSGDDGDDGADSDAGGFFSLSSLLTRASLFRSFEPKQSKRSGRQYYSACNDRITMPCIVEDFIATGAGSVPSCSPVHCGSSLCPGGNLPCRIESTVAPFGLGIHFGDGRFKGSAEDNIGACLRYNQLACV